MENIREEVVDIRSCIAYLMVKWKIMLLALNHPEKQVKLKVSGDKHVRILIWARAVLIIPFTLLSLFLFAKTVTKVFS